VTDNNRLVELAIKGLEAERDQIERELKQLQSEWRGSRRTETQRQTTEERSEIVSRSEPETGSEPQSRTAKKRRLSAAGRRAISQAMKRRWAERRAAQK
jgi:hypothetical protein